MVRVWPVGAEDDLLVGDHAPHPHRVHRDAARDPCRRGRGSMISVSVGSSAQSSDAAAIRSTVSMAVPDGASTLPSWWYSMTSPVSNHGAASSAKRIMSTAPMAKLGAMMQLDGVNVGLEPAQVVGGEPGGADDGMYAGGGGPGQVLARRLEVGEVDDDVDPGPLERADVGSHREVGHAGAAGHQMEVDPLVMGVDRGDQLGRTIRGDSSTHRAAHAATGTEDPDSKRHVRKSTQRRQWPPRSALSFRPDPRYVPMKDAGHPSRRGEPPRSSTMSSHHRRCRMRPARRGGRPSCRTRTQRPPRRFRWPARS